MERGLYGDIEETGIPSQNKEMIHDQEDGMSGSRIHVSHSTSQHIASDLLTNCCAMIARL